MSKEELNHIRFMCNKLKLQQNQILTILLNCNNDYKKIKIFLHEQMKNKIKLL